MKDANDLERFVDAQGPVWAGAMAELDAGRKTTHWIWFVFPQLRGLGRSHLADFYGIADAGEARRYLSHPLLGPRLRDSFARILEHAGQPPERILGLIDALKLRSCATLFAATAADPHPFEAVLEAFYGGQRCQRTLDMLESDR